MRSSLEKENLDIIVAFTKNGYTCEDNIEKLVMKKKVDGFIIVNSELEQSTLIFLKKSKIPFILMHPFLNNSRLEDVDTVSTDHIRGGYLAGEYLAKLGHKDIMCISARGVGNEFEQRTEGFIAGLEDKGVAFNKDKLFYGNNISFHSSYRIIMDNRDILKNTTAIFCQTDLMAMGVVEALRELKIDIPKDLSIIGYDDIELTTWFKPFLTTIHQPREEIALLSCEHLLTLINSKKTKEKRNIVIQPTLIEREYCRSNK